jgi:dolichol kinase
MTHQFILLFVFIGGYILLLIFCEFLNRRKNIASEYTRKFAHIVSALSVLLFPHVFKNEGYVLAICATLFIMLLIANRMQILHSIDEVGRRTGGSYLLALSVGIIYHISVILEDSMLFTLPILILAICDPLAGIIGKRFNSKRIFNEKTIAGSLTFLFFSLCISLFYLSVVHHKSVFALSLMIAFSTSIIELLSPRGMDNLTIPVVVTCVLILF